MEKHTHEGLKTIVRDIVEGKIYTSRVTPANIIPMVWMPLALMEKKDIDELVAYVGETGFLYEYYKKSLYRNINGHPIFVSFRYVSPEEAKWIDERHEAVQTALGATLESPEAVPAVPKDKNSPEMP